MDSTTVVSTTFEDGTVIYVNREDDGNGWTKYYVITPSSKYEFLRGYMAVLKYVELIEEYWDTV